MSWAQSVTHCVQSGGMLTSVEDPAESNFLAEHADLYTTKTSGFWIGIYRNVNGQMLWQDNSALDFVNWGEGQPSEDKLDYCVELSAFSGYWSILPCSSQKGFICKKPKIHPFLFALHLFTDAKKDKAHSHMNMWMLLTLVLIILLGMGFMIYFLFKIKTQSETQREVRQQNTRLEYSCVLTRKDDEKDSTNDKEKNEQSIV
ncbi:Macrophage mannose receptor 1 [Nipponia nippon]|uniref:Macrophage mannose receptor 1 n=1 Tax=Nipponia nippon TaxID=128390 RepID=A0A091V2I7_NIPNI|nr:Macrophage mannose receptor 1 [Nipponia nippon]